MKMHPPRQLMLIGFSSFLLALIALASNAQNDNNPRKRPRRDAATVLQPADVAALDRLSVVLGRPTQQSISANLVSAEGGDAYLEFGTTRENFTATTSVIQLKPGQPAELEMGSLKPDNQFFYRARYRKGPSEPFIEGSTHQFRTQRAPGKTFAFEIQGDSHPERPQQFDPELYARTLRAVAADTPDFYLTIGDDFSVDTLDTVNQETVTQRYRLQRPYLAIVGQTAPLFLVNGNHEQAAMANLDGTPDNVAVWAQTARNQWYVLPAPNSFYSGNSTPMAHIGLLRDYYAWTWGDALFVVIDPYWHSTGSVDNPFGARERKDPKLEQATRSLRDMWNVTLGDAQYLWLKKTLEGSKARFKFVFAHHVLGTGRGGIEQAPMFEWGGKDRRGDNTFAAKRPDWELPVHQLMVKNGVTVFFQGHDHVFAHQQLDGMTYQTLPQPADPNYATHYETAYRSGDILPNSGRVRVTVAPSKVRVEYLRSFLPSHVTAQQQDNAVAFAYDIPATKP